MRWIMVSVALMLMLASSACSSTKSSRGGYGSGISGYELSSDELAVGIKNVVYFANNSSVVTDEYKVVVEAQAEWLMKSDPRSVIIAGHCDERGTREYNMALGGRRAEAVKALLIAYGVDPSRIKVISYGKEQPDVNYSRKLPDESGYQEYLSRNRRAVVIIE